MGSPTLGFSGRTIGYSNIPITNGVAFWPDLNLQEFQQSRTIPPDLPPDTAGRAVLAAIAEVNDDLDSVVIKHQGQGHTTARDVPGAKMGDENQLTAQYKKAVYARAKADLLGEFPTIGRRETHPGQESAETRETLLAEAALVIRNMKGYRRVGIYQV
ncbi:Phage head completion protein (GPL) [Serratia entomophila]|uniref:head completion/stabilization protein n=1 Tax=Serratia entomophila TaxID=42906 RepID=UPI00217C2A64|nr:head completion/stabilization protein [Serratia entomophila]CAI1156547.1 Phage head completion protein (GPL) [Serratia entomophila]CAI1176179.1 Phage head completion protein (GPL) [Serratia entomophila]